MLTKDEFETTVEYGDMEAPRTVRVEFVADICAGEIDDVDVFDAETDEKLDLPQSVMNALYVEIWDDVHQNEHAPY